MKLRALMAINALLARLTPWLVHVDHHQAGGGLAVYGCRAFTRAGGLRRARRFARSLQGGYTQVMVMRIPHSS